MKFKDFLLKESFNTSVPELGDILSSLETIKTDIDNLNKKQILDYLNDLLVNIRGLINPKNDKNLVKILQKIGCAIIDDIKDNNDLKDTIDSSIFELKNYFEKNNQPTNKPAENSKDIKGVSKPIKTNSPKNISTNKELDNIPSDNQQLYNPPLAGTGDNSMPIV